MSMWPELSETLATQRDATAKQRASVEKLINTLRPLLLTQAAGEGELRFYETLVVSRALFDASLANMNEMLSALAALADPAD